MLVSQSLAHEHTTQLSLKTSADRGAVCVARSDRPA
jgi:hypothetical protein